jgi:hypothetical protein
LARTEAIEIAGAKLFLAAVPAVWASIREMVEREFPQLSKYFLKFARSREPAAPALTPKAEVAMAPTWRELNSLATEIEEGRVSEIASRILIANEAFQKSLTSEQAINIYLSFLARILGRLSAKSTAAKAQRAALVHRLSRDILKWQPWDEKPWVFLMHGYHLEGAYREAESVIWEALRRFNSANIWSQLIIHLSRLSDRADDYHYYSRRAAGILPPDINIIANRIRAILRKSDLEELPIACDLAGKMLSLDHNFKKQDEMKTRLFLNAHLLLLQRGGEVRDSIDKYAGHYLKTTDALSSLGWMARNFRCALQLGLMIVSRGLVEAPERVDLRDCAGLLKVIRAGSALDDAIEQADQMIEKGIESAATRNWLARALVKRNAEGDRAAARDYLIVNIARFQDEESRELLAMVEYERFGDIIATVRSENREIDVSRIRGVGEQHWATLKERFSDSAPSQHPLPNDIWSLGTLKRISILLFDEPLTPRRDAALSELDTMWRDVGTYSNRNTRDYIELLVARADKEGAHEAELPAFAARFEYALNRSDRELLQRISREYPRLTALSLVARAMFGDKSAEAEIGRYVRMNVGLPAHEKPFHDELLRRAFEGSYPPADDTKIIDLFHGRRHMIEPLVRMANEALVNLPHAA